MNLDFFTVLIAVLSLIIIAVPGFIAVKTKLLPVSATSVLSALVLYVCAPAQVFMGFQKETYRNEIAVNMLIVAGVTFFVHFAIAGIMFLCVRGKSEEKKKRVARFAGVFGNMGYMGFPFLQILFGNSSAYGEILVYGAVMLSVFNILYWTLGVYMITGDKKDISVKKILFHPVIITVVLGFLIFVIAQRPIADLCQEGTKGDLILSRFINSVDMIGNVVTPLSMFVIGMRLADVNIKQLFLDKWSYIVTFIKLILTSLITILITAILPISITVKYTLFFLLSMPTATGCALLSVLFDGDGDFASVCVLLSTLLSTLTIPLMYLLFSATI